MLDYQCNKCNAHIHETDEGLYIKGCTHHKVLPPIPHTKQIRLFQKEYEQFVKKMSKQ